MEKANKPYKNCVFKVVIQKWKNRFLAKTAWHYLCQEGRKKRIFVHTICFGQICFGPNQWKPGTTIEIVVSAEIAQNQKWHFFFEKDVFWHGWKSGFTNCVSEKQCSSENTILYCFQQNTAVAIKSCMLKKQKIDEKLWVGFEHGKKVFLFVSSGVDVIVVCFFCVTGVAQMLKILVFFSQFWGRLWGDLFLFIWVLKV